jgi:transcriptional regulator with GAF, ATPase, and Fis domain
MMHGPEPGRGRAAEVEPVPETREALRRLSALGDHDLGRDLDDAASSLTTRLPGLVGFSISIVRERLTFTYLASAVSAAGLDAMQYLDGGPCEQAVHDGHVVAVDHDDLFDEGRWQLFAQAGQSFGVASTVSLPIIEGSEVVGSVNVYGSSSDTFDGRHDELARMFGAWAPGAVTNADLLFDSRLEAAHAPERIEDMSIVDVAVGLLVALHDMRPDQARERLTRAAAQSGLSLGETARLVLRGRPAR